MKAQKRRWPLKGQGCETAYPLLGTQCVGIFRREIRAQWTPRWTEIDTEYGVFFGWLRFSFTVTHQVSFGALGDWQTTTRERVQ